MEGVGHGIGDGSIGGAVAEVFVDGAAAVYGQLADAWPQSLVGGKFFSFVNRKCILEFLHSPKVA